MICIVWDFIASCFVSADTHYYIYPSDMTKGNRNKSVIDEQGIWRYQDKLPLNLYGNENPIPMATYISTADTKTRY